MAHTTRHDTTREFHFEAFNTIDVTLQFWQVKLGKQSKVKNEVGTSSATHENTCGTQTTSVSDFILGLLIPTKPNTTTVGVSFFNGNGSHVE